MTALKRLNSFTSLYTSISKEGYHECIFQIVLHAFGCQIHKYTSCLTGLQSNYINNILGEFVWHDL